MFNREDIIAIYNSSCIQNLVDKLNAQPHHQKTRHFTQAFVKYSNGTTGYENLMIDRNGNISFITNEELAKFEINRLRRSTYKCNPEFETDERTLKAVTNDKVANESMNLYREALKKASESEDLEDAE